MEKYLDRYRIQTARLKGWDYGSPGVYFITICTYRRIHFFGKIVEPPYLAAPPNLTGDHVEPPYLAAPARKRNTPNEIDDNTEEPPGRAALRETEIGGIAREYWHRIHEFHPYACLDEFVVMPNHIHGILMIDKPGYKEWNPNKFGPQSQNLASIIRGYKSAVTSYANTHGIIFQWQVRYYDHIIRNETDLERIRDYIRNNLENWNRDKFFTP